MKKMISTVLMMLLIMIQSAFADTDWVLTQYADLSENQAMCYSLTAGDDLILIDGGWTENAPQVKEIIEANGGHVRAWFLTHYHNDHAGAFNELWNEYKEKIDVVYCTPLIWDDFIEVAQYWDSPETFETFLKITEGDEKIVRLNRGDELEVGSFHIKNFNTYDERVKQSGDIPNKCSLMLKFTIDDTSILFCGDVYSEDMSNYLLENYADELKADIVQPGHHGNNTMSFDFFENTGLKIMTFDAPEWLMTGEDYNAKDTKTWCEEHGIKVFDYTTAPNVITAADLR